LNDTATADHAIDETLWQPTRHEILKRVRRDAVPELGLAAVKACNTVSPIRSGGYPFSPSASIKARSRFSGSA
jgi:hypothetical protein